MSQPTRFWRFLPPLAGLVLLAAAGLIAGEGPAVPVYGVEIEIAPDIEHAGAYEARAVVTDLATETVVSAPRVVFLRGPEGGGKIRTGTMGGLEIVMAIEVDEAGESAVYEAVVRSGERVLSSTKVRVRLAGEESSR